MKNKYFDVAVVGGGAAGTMAYLRGVLNNDHTVLFLGDSNNKRRGRAAWVAEVDNIPGMHDLKKPILANSTSTIKWIEKHPHLSKKGKTYKSSVYKVEKEGEYFKLYFMQSQEEHFIYSRYLVVATGVMDIQPKIHDSIKPILPYANRGDVLYCLRCDGHRVIGESLSVIGNNDTAIGIGLIMKERYDLEEVAILTNGLDSEFSQEMLKRAENYNFKIISSPICGILGHVKDGLKGYRFSDGQELATTKSIVSLGIIVYNDLLRQLDAELDSAGKAIVNKNYESSVENLFVVGDLVAGKKMQIYTVWDEAVDALDEINRRTRAIKRKELLK